MSYRQQEFSEYKGENGKWVMTSNQIDFGMLGKEEAFRYSFYQDNDSIVELSRYGSGEFDTIRVFQEKFKFKGWISDITESKDLKASGFKLVDFDKDGYEDMVVDEIISGDISSKIFILDPKSLRLIKLYNTGDETDIWVNPVYDKKSATITCRISDENTAVKSTFRIKEYSAYPVTKTEIATTETNTYIGKNGKWKQIKKKKHKQ